MVLRRYRGNVQGRREQPGEKSDNLIAIRREQQV
jgi:hypothetical protein